MGSPVRPGAVRADRGCPRLPRRGPRSDEHRQHDNLRRDHRLRPVHQTRPPDLRWKATRHPTGAHEETSAGITSCRGGRSPTGQLRYGIPGSPGDRSRCASTDVEWPNRVIDARCADFGAAACRHRPPHRDERRPHPAHGQRHQLRRFQIGSTRRADGDMATHGQMSPGPHGRRREQDAPSISLGTAHPTQYPSRQIRLTLPFTGSGSRLRIPGACRCSTDRCQGSAANVRITSVARPSFGYAGLRWNRPPRR